MKKKVILCLSLIILVHVMSGCAGLGSEKVVKDEIPVKEEQKASVETDEDTSIKENKERNKSVLIAYFSRIGNIDSEYKVDATSSASVVIAGDSMLGNTEYMARLIQAEISGDLHFIETKEKYSSHYDSTDNNKLDVQTNIEHRENARPELVGEISNMEDYDVVFLGFPNWWNDFPMAVYSFLDEYDLSGKKVYLFNTSGGGGAANTLKTIQELEPNADINENILTVSHFDFDNFDEDDVKDWMEEIEYEKN
ncbi:flavodoxin [Lachnospiraceae bacterium KM106-2]|nr:flavodoxin [Lachnospiraceae bacterium KM106-2]